MSAESHQWSPIGAFGARAERADRQRCTSAVPPRIAGAIPRLPSDVVTAAEDAVLMEVQERHTPGRWRTEPVLIGCRTDSPIGADFVAPHQTRIAEATGDLVRFMSRTDLPTLVTVALTHAQFETIHPFTDGNGRTGRALAQAQLRHLAAARNVALPVSAGLLADVRGYHDALTATRAGDPAPIVSAFAAAEELGVQQPNVYPPLRALEDAGIVAKADECRLGPSWRADEILDALDRFAQRAGRRSLA